MKTAVTRTNAVAPTVVAAFCALASAGCTFSPTVRDGKIFCYTADDCPNPGAMMCMNQACWARVIVGGTDAGGPDRQAPDANRPDASLPETTVDTPAADVASDARDALNMDSGREAGPEVRPDATMETAPGCGADDLTSGLLYFLPLDDGGKNPIVDEASPNNLEALVNNLETGASWTAGRFGSALTLSGGGAGAWIRVGGQPSTPLLNSAFSAFSFSLWAKFPKGKPADGVILSRRAEGAKGFLYRISVSSGRLRAQLYTTNGNRSDVTANQALPIDGAWMHIAGTYAAGGQGGLQIFVNGTSVGRDALFALQLGDENTPAMIGAAEDPLALTPSTSIIDRLTATIDDVAFYTRALPVSAIKALACGARP